MIVLKKIDLENVWKIVKLSVKEEQENFVSPNIESIVEAYVAITSEQIALPFGMYSDGALVGFVMFGYGIVESDGGEPLIADGNYSIWRFMIDEKFQGQGLGRKALRACLDYLKTLPCGDAIYCWLSYEPENYLAKELYTSMGFKENGEKCGDEIVAILEI